MTHEMKIYAASRRRQIHEDNNSTIHDTAETRRKKPREEKHSQRIYASVCTFHIILAGDRPGTNADNISSKGIGRMLTSVTPASRQTSWTTTYAAARSVPLSLARRIKLEKDSHAFASDRSIVSFLPLVVFCEIDITLSHRRTF